MEIVHRDEVSATIMADLISYQTWNESCLG
jgi:hypothetical protein